MIKVGTLRRMVEGLPDDYKRIFLESFEGSASAWVEAEDDRELGDVTGKPHTISEIIGCLKEETQPRLHESFLYANYPDQTKVYYLPERVGLDACSFDVVIDRCDGKVFEDCIKEYTDSEQYPMIHTTAVSEANSDKFLPMPGWDHQKYQKIEVILSPYFKAIFQYVYAVDKFTGEKRPDSYKIETRVVPPEGHEELGNIDNYAVEQEMTAITEGLDQLEEMGIYISRSEIRMHSIELNLTFHMDCDFSDLKRPLQYYQRYIDARYVNTLYVYNGKKREEFAWSDPEEKYAKMKLSGMQSKAKKIVVKLYDKAYETIFDARYHRNPEHLISFETYVRQPKKTLVRLEFRLSGQAAIFDYLGETYLHKVSQNTLITAYTNLVDHYFIRPYEKYYEDSTKKLKDLFTRMADEQITKRGRNWKAWLLQEIRAEEISSQSTPMVLESQDIEDFFWQVPTFKHDKNRYREELYELLDTANIYKKDYKNSYGILGNFFLKTWCMQGLSEQRRLGYTLDREFDELYKMMQSDINYTDIGKDNLTWDRLNEHNIDRKRFDDFMDHLDDHGVKQLLRFVDDIRELLEVYGDGTNTTLPEDKEFMKFHDIFSGFIDHLHEIFEEKGDDITSQFPELEYMEDELNDLQSDIEDIYDNIFNDDDEW